MTNKEIMYHALTRYAMDQWDYACELYDQSDDAYNHGDTEQAELIKRRAVLTEELGNRIDDMASKYSIF